ncbi:MAG: histidine kinase [Actinomycetota bacterium]|nr:histidine kinase [Actinomycetota bacterium]
MPLHHGRRGLPVGDRVALTFALALLAVQALNNNEGARGVDARDFDAGAALVLAGAFALALAARRTPAIAALGVLGLTVVWYTSGYTSGVINVPYLVIYYLLGATGDRQRQLLVGGFAVVVMLVAMLAAGDESVSDAAAAIGWTMAALLFGEASHNRRALFGEYEARALRAEGERDAEAERRVAQTRLEIARDLHDVLAHTVSVMTVQAGVGQDALARGTDGAAAALGTIRAAGKEAMEEIQALVAVLRNGNLTDAVTTAPAPRLDRLQDLVAATEAAGVNVKVVLDVRPGAATEVAELTAYRVVQESLTNVVRHAAAGTATVSVGLDGADLLVQVSDDGATSRSTPTDHLGFGLQGMRERVESLGGHLRAGPDPSGGWRVTARIPRERRRAP